MKPKYYFHELPHKEKSKFFAQEEFYEFLNLRKWLVFVFIAVLILDTLLRFFVFPVIENRKRDFVFSTTVYFLIAGNLSYILTLTRFFQRKSPWIFRLRYGLYFLSAIGNGLYIFLGVLASVDASIRTQSIDNWTFALISVLNCIHSTAIIFLLSPTWYFKFMIMGCCHLGIIIGYWRIGSPMKNWILLKGLVDLFYLFIYVVLSQYFRWKLFLKNSEAEGKNEVYRDILDRLLSLIVIIDSSKEVVYSNLPFQTLAGKSAKSLFTNIVNLKIRDFAHRVGTAETHAYNFYGRLDSSSLDQRQESLSSPTCHNPLFKHKESSSRLPQRFENLESLIEHFSDLMTKGELQNEDQIVFDAKMNKISSSRNVVLSYEVIVRPLIERKKIILTLNNTTQRDLIASLEDNNQFKDKLLASVSHELRTPLNGNIGFLQAALYEESVPQMVKDRLLLPALRSGKLLCHLINDILDYSKMQTEQIKLTPELKPLKETFEYCYQLLEHGFRKKGLEFKLIVDQSLSYLFRTDHDRLIQVTLNLLSNALKFTRRGTVCLEARACDDPHVAEILVSDSGLGIAKKDIPRLFEDQALVKEEEEDIEIMSKGAGLGLKISNILAKILGPAEENGIRVRSVLGQGSTFSFKIKHRDADNNIPLSINDLVTNISHRSEKSVTSMPEIPPEQFLNDPINVKCFDGVIFSERRTQSSQAMTALHSMKARSISPTILLVDDDLINILALQQILKQFHVQTDVAYNGQEALEKMVGHPSLYKLVLMDCQMPIMDGFEASKQITQKMKTGDLPIVPIVGCTAFSSKDKIDECLNSGMREVLSKPVMRDKLKEILSKYLKQI